MLRKLQLAIFYVVLFRPVWVCKKVGVIQLLQVELESFCHIWQLSPSNLSNTHFNDSGSKITKPFRATRTYSLIRDVQIISNLVNMVLQRSSKKHTSVKAKHGTHKSCANFIFQDCHVVFLQAVPLGSAANLVDLPLKLVANRERQ